MRFLATATVFLLPLAIAPGLFFYHDVTPKAVIVFAAAALGLYLVTRSAENVEQVFQHREGRRYLALCALLILVTLAASALSPNPEPAWGGSNWRRFGAIAQSAAIILGAVLVIHACSGDRSRTATLRALALAGAIAAFYGILQYFGWDPILPASAYEAGEGPFRIVRPPGTLGHSDYFGAFLLWTIYAGLAVWLPDGSKSWKRVGLTSMMLGAISIVLSGSRGAVAGLVTGALAAALLLRPRLRLVLGAAITVLCLGAIFYLSPAGQRLRARAHWIGEDPQGGARLLLWRDSAAMAAARPVLGWGSDTFASVFPQFQSVELSRAYPDFYHESAHNLFLDFLTAKGILGLIVVVALCCYALASGWRARRLVPGTAPPLLCGLLAALVAHQFAVLTLPAEVILVFFAGLLMTLDAGKGAAVRPMNGVIRGAAVVVSLLFLAEAAALAVSDYRLAVIKADLDRGAVEAAASGYRAFANSALARAPFARVQADLYFSRRFASASTNVADVRLKLLCGQLAFESAVHSTQDSEQPANAWYNLALLVSSQGNAAAVEANLRQAISSSPRWFKPHWTLARLLQSQGRTSEARAEARTALDLDGGKHDEVVTTMNEILRSAP